MQGSHPAPSGPPPRQERPPRGPKPGPTTHAPQASFPAVPALVSLGSPHGPLAHTARPGQPQHWDTPGSPEMQRGDLPFPLCCFEGDPISSSQRPRGTAASIPASK